MSLSENAWGSEPRSGDEPRLARTALSIVDGSIALTVIVVPLMLGGRHDAGRWVFIALAGVGATAWCVRQAASTHARWRFSNLYLIPLLASLMLALQCTALPPEFLAWLSPNTAEVLPTWGPESPFGAWTTLSFAPAETRLALANLIAYGLLFATVHQRVGSVKDARRLINLVAASAVGTALFGLVHTPLSNGLHYWCYEVPFCSPAKGFCGGFTNRNHFADFLVLGLGPVAAWTVLRVREKERTKAAQPRRQRTQAQDLPLDVAIGLTALALVVLLVILSCSRGGVVALLASGTALATIYYRGSLITTRHLAAAALVALVASAVITTVGYDRLSKRMETLFSGSLEEVDQDGGRRTIWTANLNAFGEHPIAGTGAGTHRDVHPVFVPQHNGLTYSHAENGYLQVLSENGVPGCVLLGASLLVLVAGGFAAIRRAQTREATALAGAAVASLVGSLTHAAVDFVWYIPACGATALILAACLFRLTEIPGRTPGRSAYRLAAAPAWALAGCVALVACWSLAEYTGPAMASFHWDRYHRTAIANRKMIQHEVGQLRPTANYQSLRVASTEAMIDQLRDVLRWRPDSARGHRLLASKYAELFDLRQVEAENALTADQLRDTARSGGFEDTRQLQAWLERAVGENLQLLTASRRHARLALHYCPVGPAPYLQMADTGFLVGQSAHHTDALLEQALRVAPHNPRVLYQIGAYKLNTGHPEEAESLWQRSYRVKGPHRVGIIRTLAFQTSASYFVETFQPTWDSLELVWQSFSQSQPGPELEKLVAHATRAARDEPRRDHPNREARKWITLSQMYDALDQQRVAAACLSEGYRRAPHNHEVRRNLGMLLSQSGDHAAAEPHLRWCLGRRPNDELVRQALVLAAKHRLAAHRAEDHAWK